MMHIHHSNRTEVLLKRFVAITRQPLTDPLAPETVVVQNPGMARWLAQQFAIETGIAANLDFPLPATFVWRIYRAWRPVMPEESDYDREALHWRILALLPAFLSQPAFAELDRYLQDDAQGLKAYQLAGRIADVFDQYLVYRPEWVLAWEAGQGNHWQAVLWRAVVENAGGMHRAGIFDAFCRAAESGPPPSGVLPERVSLFGLTALAPVHLHAFDILSRHRPLHLFLLNPSAEYWADIVDDRGQARRRALWRRTGTQDFSGLLDVGNPLLAAFGHTGQGFLDQLLETGGHDHDAFADPGEANLLACLQHDLMYLRDRRTDRPPTALAPGDPSVQIHACHTPMREVQVLHDRLLALFEALPHLHPREVVVMAPDIDIYAPHVEAVFDAAPEARFIPWSMADRRITAREPVVETLLGLLDLPEMRLSASEVLGLLEVPAVSRRFTLDAEGLARVRIWVAEAGIRWGLDGAMRAALDLPAESANTWQAGLARLFLGYAMPPEEVFFGGALSYPDVEGVEARDLGMLQTLVDRLAHWRTVLKTPAPAEVWLQRINDLIDDFLAPDPDEAESLQTLRRAAEKLGQTAERAGLKDGLEARVIRAHLEARLATAGGARRFLLGGVTFCNMVPMRAIPFRVVCLLGLNDTDFPRRQKPPGFDLIARHPRPGDRSRRLDDRYLFLEALLSARDVFYISYLGSDVRDNSQREPSVVASELLDYIDRSWRLPGGGTPSTRLVRRHPLQPFSPRLFDGQPTDLFSYDARWCPAAPDRPPEAPEPFAARPLPVPANLDAVVDISDLARFFSHPARWFLQRRLGIQFSADQGPVPDEEPFDIVGLERYGARDILVAEMLAGHRIEEAGRKLRARGQVPHGAPGEAAWDEVREGMDLVVQRIQEARRRPVVPLELDIVVGGIVLRGWLSNLTENGRVAFRPGALKARDRVQLWIHHLALCAATAAPQSATSLHVAADRVLRLAPVPDPLVVLQDLLALFHEGQSAPLPFFPETSHAYVEALDRCGAPDKALDACRRVWRNAHNARGEAFDGAVQLAWRGQDPLQAKFQRTARRVFEPLTAVAREEPLT
jgi:exodeoxyribonuclease V gamma subunit